MQSVWQPEVNHQIESAGVDWITASAQHGYSRWDMTEFARHQRERFMDAGITIKPAYRLGYDGWQGEGFFYGQREGGTLVVASGATANDVHRSLINVADNISRLDLQVTISTPIDRPHLGVQAHAAIKGGSPSRIHVKNASLITTHPQGETCSIGKRSSDWYGRIYDKATESGQGAPRSRWRYEVEAKRACAARLAAGLSGDQSAATFAQTLVHEWFTSRGVAPVFKRASLSCPQEYPPAAPQRDVLSWFHDSLSVTVQRAVRRHGLLKVLEALSLVHDVDEFMKEVTEDGTRLRRTV